MKYASYFDALNGVLIGIDTIENLKNKGFGKVNRMTDCLPEHYLMGNIKTYYLDNGAAYRRVLQRIKTIE